MKKLLMIFIVFSVLGNLFAQVEVEKVGSLYNFWNYPDDYLVIDEYAFVTHDGTIEIYRILNDDKIELVNQIYNHVYYNLKQIGGYLVTAYSYDYKTFFEFYDVANPENPVKIKVIEKGDGFDFLSSVINGNYAYSDNLKVWDITDVFNPVLVFSSFDRFIDLPYGRPLQMEGGYLQFIGSQSPNPIGGATNALYYLIDVSNPTNPVLQNNNLPVSGKINDSLYYSIQSWNYLLVVKNYSDPDNPVTVSSIKGIAGAFPKSLFFTRIGDYVYARVWDTNNIDTTRTDVRKPGDIYIINISDPFNPFLDKVYHPQADYGSPKLVPILIGNKIYAMSRDAQFGILDLSDPANPVETMTELSENPAGELTTIKISGDYAFVQDVYRTYYMQAAVTISKDHPMIRIINISDPKAAYEIGNIKPGVITDYFVENNYVYVKQSNDKILIYNISSPANPVLEDSLGQEYAYIFTFYDGYAYAKLPGRIVRAYDMSNPASPQVIYTYQNKYFSSFDTGDEKILYLTYFNDTYKYNITDPANPIEIAKANIGGPKWLRNSIWYSIGGDNKLRIRDYSNLSNYVELCEPFELPANSIIHAIDDNYIYATGQPESASVLFLIDIIDPANPGIVSQTLIRHYKITNPQIKHYAAVSSNYIYITNYISFDIYKTNLALPPEDFSLISPEIAIDTTAADLLWRSTTDPNGSTPTFDVYLATTSAFSDQYKIAGGLTDTTFHVSDLMIGQTYYWKVHATDVNTSGTWSANNLSFTIISPEVTVNFINNIGGETKGGVTTLDENTIYVPSSSKVVRLNSDGSVGYTLNVNGTIKSSSTITSDHTVYIASTDNNLYSFNSNGVTNANWPVALGAEATASVAVGPNNNLYIGTSNGIYQAISREGAILWSYNVGAAVYSSSVISSSGILYVINKNGRLFAFDLATLDPNNVQYKWRLELGEAVSSSPALDESGNLYITTEPGKLLKVNDLGASGSIEWTYDSEGACESSPVIDALLNIYFTGKSGKVFAVNGGTGNLIWEAETYYSHSNPETILKSSPTLSADGSKIYVGDTFGTLYGISTAAGEILWSYKGEGTIEGPILYNSNKIFYCGEGKVFSITEPIFGKKKAALKESAPVWPTFQGNPQRTGYNGEYETVWIKQDNSVLPVKFFVSSNYPNPFNPSTVFSVGLPQSSTLEIFVYNLLGQKVASITNGEYKAGVHQFIFNAKDLPSGMYFMQVFVEGKMNKVQKMLLLR